MKHLRFSASGVRAALFSATLARVFCGVMLECPEVHNGAWLAVLIGGALAAAPLFFMARIAKAGPDTPVTRALGLLFALWLPPDISSALRLTAHSANFLAFDRIPSYLMILPLLPVLAWATHENGAALGAVSRVLLKLLPAFLAVILLIQAPRFEPGWLFPLLGDGFPGIWSAALRIAGWFTLLSGFLLCAEDGGERKGFSFLALHAAAFLSAAALVLLQEMMIPVRVAASPSRVYLLDALLTTGRAPLALQLPMVICWFFALLNCISCECFAAGALLQRAFPGLGKPLAGALSIGAVAALSLPRTPSMLTEAFLPDLAFPVLSCAALAVTIVIRASKGAKKTCAIPK